MAMINENNKIYQKWAQEMWFEKMNKNYENKDDLGIWGS